MLTTRSGFCEEAVDDLGRDRVAADQLDVARLDRRRERLGVDDRRDRHLVELGPLRIVVVRRSARARPTGRAGAR